MVRTIALTLTVLCLHLAVYAQGNGNRDREKPANQTPSVGTGGPEGGPTGLFTIYDGSTLRRGEFTFSIAYSNFDRDPGNVDIVDVPLSFNVGVNDHLELFFKTKGYRRIKVINSKPSTLYLPNSQLLCGTALCNPATLVLAPSGLHTSMSAARTLFRSVNNQPFMQFTTDSSAGTFILGTGQIDQPFAFPGFNTLLGPPVVQPNNITFSSVHSFKSLGSQVETVLPGIVLTPNGLPTYLADAPFINLPSGVGVVGVYRAGREFVLLDRPGEFIADVGFDFWVNRHFQPIAEVRPTQYVVSTPDTFDSDSIDVQSRVKIYPRRWVGFNNAYRRQKGNDVPAFAVNTPLTRLTLGMFIWDPNVSEEDRQQIRMALKRAPEYIKKTCIFWRANSLECRYLREAVNALGPENVDNGVTLSVGPTQTESAAAETSVGCVKSRTKTKSKATGDRITVTLPKETVNSESLPMPLFHEGSHVADAFKWWRSGCKRSKSPFVYETEFKAYIVTTLVAQAHKPDATFEFTLPGGGPPGKNPFLPERFTIFRPGLGVGELRALRDANIIPFLARPKDAGGQYGVTPDSPGARAFGSGSSHR
jgi:hypothetical protein